MRPDQESHRPATTTRTLLIVALLVLAVPAAPVAFADINPNIGGNEHTHTDKAHGRLLSLRVQTQGMEYGPRDDRLDAEVLVTLDSKPGMTFGVRYHEGAQPATAAMVDILKDAYLRELPVTLFYVSPPGKKNVNALLVELSR